MLAGPLLFGPPPKQLIQTLDNPTTSTYIDILIFPLNFSYIGCMTKVLSTCRIGNTLGTYWERALEPLRTWWEHFGKSCEILGNKTIHKIPSYPPLSKRGKKNIPNLLYARLPHLTGSIQFSFLSAFVTIFSRACTHTKVIGRDV
jgi:hypothetical protein